VRQLWKLGRAQFAQPEGVLPVVGSNNFSVTGAAGLNGANGSDGGRGGDASQALPLPSGSTGTGSVNGGTGGDGANAVTANTNGGAGGAGGSATIHAFGVPGGSLFGAWHANGGPGGDGGAGLGSGLAGLGGVGGDATIRAEGFNYTVDTMILALSATGGHGGVGRGGAAASGHGFAYFNDNVLTLSLNLLSERFVRRARPAWFITRTSFKPMKSV